METINDNDTNIKWEKTVLLKKFFFAMERPLWTQEKKGGEVHLHLVRIGK